MQEAAGNPAASPAIEKPVLDRIADVAEDLRDLATQEDEGDDRDDRDEGEDQGVFGEALPLLVARDERRDEDIQTSHGGVTSFPSRVSRPAGAGGPEPGGSQSDPLDRGTRRLRAAMPPVNSPGLQGAPG